MEITKRILFSILTGHQNVSAIQRDTRLHPETASGYLKRLDEQGLIAVDAKDWKRGKSKHCLVTNVGIAWLIDTSLNGTLQVLSRIITKLKSTRAQGIFQRANAERYSRDMKIIQNYFIERLLKGDKSPVEYPVGLDSADPSQPFREALKKILALYLYLISNPLESCRDFERTIENDFVLFAPDMTFAFGWHRGEFPELECQLRKVENYYQNESDKLKKSGDDRSVSQGTHLLGLERVDEEIYHKYVKARSKSRREKILAKIEDEVGWSVGVYLRRLSIGKKAEIAKYTDGLHRPSLKKFISSFQNHSRK